MDKRDKIRFEKFLKSIGGLESGWFSCPNRYTDPLKYYLFLICRFFKIHDDHNPFRRKIYSSGYFSYGKGWYKLTEDLITELIAVGWDKKILQAKEKYGSLRFYTGAMSKEAHDIVSKYEKLSLTICEVCGQPGECRLDAGWWRTLCEKHSKHL